MANVKYGVNIIPRTNNTYTIGNSDYKWANIYTVQLNGVNVANLATNSIATSSAAGLMSAADKAKLDTLSAFNATDYTVNIATTDWVNNSYTWTNSAVTSTAYIIVNFTSSVNDYVRGMLDYTKVSGGVQFNVESTPTGTITLIVGVIDGASGTSIIGEADIDVQINGTSIVDDGVANIPVADVDTLGTVKVRKADGYYGIGMLSNGTITTSPATDAQVAIGTEAYKPLNPKRQHIATFFGLSKAAGVDLAQVSVNFGEYPASSKAAIQSMLAVPSSNNPIFTGAFSQNRKSNTTIGTNSFSSGDNCEASAEDSHAEGRYTTASGHYSHAEGNYTTASGMASHAEGTVTIANHVSQHVFGEYNVEDSSSADIYSRGNYVEIVGNGTASNAQSNARALDWSGNEYLNGYIYVGCGNNSTNGTRIPHDIQINSTSIVSNGVANIPIGSTTTPGVFIRGYGLYQDGAKLGVNGSTSENIKRGTAGTFTPVSKQHEATFYGLAKAAGDSTQSASSNAVGVYTNNAKTAIQNMLGITTMTGATSSIAGTSGLVPAPTTGDVDKFLAGDGTYKSGGLPMVILSYGNSTWADFEAAYNNNVIVYCRASSNANPKTGSQTRMAFMAYVNNETTPTNVEFQYYRSMSSHSGTQMGDQVYVYKLDKNSGWSVTVREAGLKEIEFDASTGLQATWSNNKLTITTI